MIPASRWKRQVELCEFKASQFYRDLLTDLVYRKMAKKPRCGINIAF